MKEVPYEDFEFINDVLKAKTQNFQRLQNIN